MSDLDFDELDQAVASAMEGRAPSSTDRTVQPRPAERQFSTSRSSTPVAKRTSGRFMDVVHPSSDMRPEKSEEISQSQSTPPSADLPNLSDFQGFKPSDSSEPEATEPKDNESDTDKTDDASPLSSPFLSDAKIEKRPLGAFSTTDSKDDEKSDSLAKKDFTLPPFQLPGALKMNKDQDGEPENELELGGRKIEPPLPAELQDDLLTVERDATLIETASPDLSPDTVKAPSTVVDGQKMPSIPFDDKGRNETPPPMPSIVQQYKERASSAQSATGAIYDTETYHKPMVTLPQKKNSWLIIVWILGLIILGGGLGAAAYFFVLPLLV